MKLLSLIFMFKLTVAEFFTQSLNGQWAVSILNDKNSLVEYANFTNIPALVPGDIYNDLYSNNLIDNPLVQFNDVKYRWIGLNNWTYFRDFEISDELYNHDEILLIFNGLDTVASVYVNSKLVLKSSNMFIAHKMDVKPYLRKRKNNISVAFESPVKYARRQAELHQKNFKYGVPPDCFPGNQNGECHINFIRKAQFQFSWDWGAAMPTVGIWQNVSLIGISNGCIFLPYNKGFSVTPKQEHGHWSLYFDAKMWCSAKLSSNGAIFTLRLPELAQKFDISITNFAKGENLISKTVTLPTGVSKAVKLWYPNNYGSQSLYSVDVSFTLDGKKFVFADRKRIGFRTVELIQDFVNETKPEFGRNFYFKVDGIPVFLKGTNWVPLSLNTFESFASSGRDRMDFLIDSMVAANMNAVRVWGGGYYESDYFYSRMDEAGILVWQDFVFACALYPANKPFLAGVRQEVREQVIRLAHHPSILLLAGSNENELGLRDGWFKTNFTTAGFE